MITADVEDGIKERGNLDSAVCSIADLLHYFKVAAFPYLFCLSP